MHTHQVIEHQVESTWELWMYYSRGNWEIKEKHMHTSSHLLIYAVKHTHINTVPLAPHCFLPQWKGRAWTLLDPFLFFSTLSYPPTELNHRGRRWDVNYTASRQGHFNSTAKCFPESVFFSERLFPMKSHSALLRPVIAVMCMWETSWLFAI